MSKIDLNDSCEWIAHPSGGGGDEESKKLIARRAELDVIGRVNDAEADYSYDDYALVRLGAKYYLLNTSGCSCPSPTETWVIAHGPVGLEAMKTYLLDVDKVHGYGVTHRQHKEFLDLIRVAKQQKRDRIRAKRNRQD